MPPAFLLRKHTEQKAAGAPTARGRGASPAEICFFAGTCGYAKEMPTRRRDGALSHAALEDTCAYMAPESRAASVVSKDLSSVDAITLALACQRVTRIRIHVSLRVYV